MYLVVISYCRATVINILNLRLRLLIYRLISSISLRRSDLLASFSSNMYHDNTAFCRYMLILAFIKATGFIVAKLVILFMNSIANL